MKTFLFTLSILLLVGGGVWYKFYDLPSFLANNPKATAIVPVSEWNNIIPGGWHMLWVYHLDGFAWIENADIDYYKNGEFKKHSTFVSYNLSNSSVFKTVEDIIKYGEKDGSFGGRLKGTWKVDSINGNWVEKISSSEIPGWDHSTFVRDKFPFGNYEDAEIKTWIEVFKEDTIKISGKRYSNDAQINFIFIRVK